MVSFVVSSDCLVLLLRTQYVVLPLCSYVFIENFNSLVLLLYVYYSPTIAYS